jgi:hypothetical protein
MQFEGFLTVAILKKKLHISWHTPPDATKTTKKTCLANDMPGVAHMKILLTQRSFCGRKAVCLAGPPSVFLKPRQQRI